MDATRRTVTLGLTALSLLSGISPALAQEAATPAPDQPGLRLGEPRPFSFDLLIENAQKAAAQPYAAPIVRFDDILDRIDPNVYQDIRFRADQAVWANGNGPWPIQLFHPGRWFKTLVQVNVLEGGQAHEVLYERELFELGPKADFVRGLPEDLGFAGFRVMNRDRGGDWLSFLGASYFRATGRHDQYGLSARGIAIDTGLQTPEEFPAFREFWIGRSERSPQDLVIYAYLDGPALTGAYRFEVSRPGDVVMDVNVALFMRHGVQRLGIAPLTSMYWYSETNRRVATDWRPEIHDSDGLSMWTGSGERLWRPLNNPTQMVVSSFVDHDPRGFGLMQRDRTFASYEDDALFYERRPSLWIQPLNPWGDGAVQLVEIPTNDEIHDNIAAYWVPGAKTEAGQRLDLQYRLTWGDEEPGLPPIGRCVATRMGRGGPAPDPNAPEVRRFAIDFAGGTLDGLKKGDPVAPVVATSRGEIRTSYVFQLEGEKRWRAIFDLTVDGEDPVDLRLYLRLNDDALTETWLYQYHPFRYAQVPSGFGG